MRNRSLPGVGLALVLSLAASGVRAQGVHKAPEDGGPRNWVVRGPGKANLRESPSTRAPVVATLEAGAILDNLSCLQAGGRTWCDVQVFGGGPRGFVAAALLDGAVSPDGSVSKGPDDSALRAGQGKWDARGQLPCAQHKGQPTGQCDFIVARAGGGYATVVVTHPDGRKRAIYFRRGIAIGADTSQADGYPAFRATRDGDDLTFVFVGEERYEIVDAVILGG